MKMSEDKIPYFPLFIDLHRKRVIVAGAGRIASRRIETLLPFGADITVIAPETGDDFRKIRVRAEGEPGTLAYIKREFRADDMKGAFLVLAATDSEDVNAWIAGLCRDADIPVNVSSDRSLCDFYFPGIVRNGNIVVGITASGADHHKVKELRERIDEEISQNRKP